MTDTDLSNNSVMITGAGGGFGQAMSMKFAEHGARLILSDINEGDLEKTLSTLPKNTSVFAEPVDITNPNQVMSHIEQCLQKFDTLDIAINNAGIGQSLSRLHETDKSDFDRIMLVNTTGTFHCLQHQLRQMIAQNDGVILNIASAAGLVGAGHMAAYAASKHAVIGLTKSAADEVARHNIRVNALCPSFAQTPLLDDVTKAMGQNLSPAEQAQKLTTRVPMRRLATTQEVAEAAFWATSPKNSFMTGQAISIDGGLTAI